jgi:hypothetical protein
VLNRSKKAVNVVNMVNVAEHCMSYVTPNRPDHAPTRLGYQKTRNYVLAEKELGYTLKLNPNFAHADEIKKVLAQTPQVN